VEDNRESFCKALRGKPLFSALYGTYTVTLNELKSVLKANNQTEQTKQADDFKEVRSRKRHSTGEAVRTPKKATVAPPTMKVPTSNFFAPSEQPTWTLIPQSQSPTQKRQQLQ
jgi:hypothetical protein